MNLNIPTKVSHFAKCLAIPLVVGFLYFLATNYWTNSRTSTEYSQEPRYVINSQSCRILNFNQFDNNVKRFFQRKEFEPCNEKHLLTRVSQLTNGSFAINIEINVTKEYHNPAEEKLTCCYEVVTRKSENSLSKSKCMEIKEETILDVAVEYILVTCNASHSTFNYSREVYKDAHAIVPVKPDVRTRLTEFKSKRAEKKVVTPPSVLMFAIDSVSRLNFRRIMSRTLQHLQATGWVELNAYNKIADVTYPNAMALFGGYNYSESFGLCRPRELGGLDNCSIIWSKFQDNGYVTAYVEDTPTINTFNFRKKGFLKQPTDYYSRPYFMAMESSLPFKSDSFCLGSITESERILKYMIDFTHTFKSDPYFGIFWINSLCHNSLEMPPSMDIKIKDTFVKLSNAGILNNTIIFFFSDHGIRFKKVKLLPTAVFEERLPFMHVWIPQKFRVSHPELFANLVQNSNKLTTPYDIHMTLQHILSLFSNDTQQPSRGCPKCSSILKPIPFDRSCAEAGVNVHWCACDVYERLRVDDARVIAVAEFVVLHINNVIFDVSKQYPLKLKRILYASVMKNGTIDPKSNETSVLHTFCVGLVTIPGNTQFESSVTVDKNNTFEIEGSVNRLYD